MMVMLAVTHGSAAGQTEKATLGAGCFWCAEAVFQRVDGVIAVVAGYTGGTTENPTYEEVSTGTTGHAEVAQITFDPTKVSYKQLLDIFWQAHDPTTLNKQGVDVGTQYRSVIFTHSVEQARIAAKSKEAAASLFEQPIVTQILPLTRFTSAEDYHQDYFRHNPNAPYCRFVIAPKVEKLKQKKMLDR
jgi:peptide-methionine (S)-S-oxide reductase